MKALRTAGTNVNLTLSGHGPERDLPAERCVFIDEDSKVESPGFETTWKPTSEELEKLAAGNPIVLRIHGEAHPPVSLSVGEVAIAEPSSNGGVYGLMGSGFNFNRPTHQLSGINGREARRTLGPDESKPELPTPRNIRQRPITLPQMKRIKK